MGNGNGGMVMSMINVRGNERHFKKLILFPRNRSTDTTHRKTTTFGYGFMKNNFIQHFLILAFVILGINSLIFPVHASELKGDPNGVTEITQNSIFILGDLSNPITQEQENNLFKKLISTHTMISGNQDAKFFIGSLDIDGADTLPLVALGISIDDDGMIHQFVGKAHTNDDVIIIHEQANAWKNKSLAHFLDEQYPLQEKLSDSPTFNHSKKSDDSVTVWEDTCAVSNLPFGEIIGQYTLKKIIKGNAWDLFGLQTDVVTIPGHRISNANSYLNSETRINHLWNGPSQKFVRLHSDPNTNFKGNHKIEGLFHSAVNTTYSYSYYQTNATEIINYKYTDASPEWIFDSSNTSASDYRSEFSPVSLVAMKKQTSVTDQNPNIMTIKTSAEFVNSKETGVPGRIMSNVSIKLVNLLNLV